MATPSGSFGTDDIKKEGLGEVQDFFTIDKSDDELVRMIDGKIRKAYGEYEKLKEEGKLNERYWARNQLEGIQLYWHNSRIVQNRIYMSVETMIPIITSKPAEPMVSIADDEEEDSEKSKKLTGGIEKVLLDKYYDEERPQQEVFEMIARHLLLYKLGILKVVWSEKDNDYYIEFVHPHKVIISPDGHYNEDVWVAQYLEWSLQDIVEEFPDKKDSIMANLFPGKTPPENMMGTPVGFWEYWSEDGKYLVWKMHDTILQKKLNPYIKWDDDKSFDEAGNHFDTPRKPYMFLNSQNLGRHIWDDTTPVSQGISLQDGINLMQRIIVDTSKDQGILVGANELIDRDELYKYTGAPNEKLSVKGGDPTKALYRVPAKQLQSFVQENLSHLENALDNIMGTHSTTRGERQGQETMGGRQLLKESDFGRIDAVVRGIERMASELYNWEMQMMVIKYKKEHYAKVLGKKNGAELKDGIDEAVKKGIKIIVKPGSTLPTDKISQRQEAIELAKANKIDAITFFERMDFPNPRESAKRLLMWEDPKLRLKLFPDLVKELEKENKQLAQNQGRLNEDGSIQPEVSVEAGQVSPPAMAQPEIPQPILQTPVAPQVPVQQPATSPTGTEHTQALIQGTSVQPFEGIQPSEEHVSQELQFMATDEFLQLPEEIQALYAKHVLDERRLLQTQGDTNAGSVEAMA